MSIITPVPHSQTTNKPRSLECSITSYSWCRLVEAECNALRKQSDKLPGDLGNSLLRHCDEQTLASLVAVRDAIEQQEPKPTDLQDWGVVCSSRYLGRSAFAQNLVKFAAEGPWNVSVQVVPNRSLHSPASMVSLALGCHGPCIGVGGGLDGETDAWITATTLLDQQSLPGLWLVFAGWEPDPLIDAEGEQITESKCSALALALRPASAKSAIARLRIGLNPTAPATIEVPAKQTALRFFESFAHSDTFDQTASAMLGGGLCAEFDRLPATISALTEPAATQLPIRKAA